MSRQPNDTNYQFPMPQPQQQDPSIEHQSGYSTPIQPTTQTQSTYSFTPQQSQQSINQSSNRIDIANDLDNLNLNRQISELEDFYGPYLKFNGVLNNQWYGSVMIVSRSILQLKLNTPNPLLLDPLVLYKYKDYSFQRYTFNTPLTSATKLTYSILDITYTISIPGANEPIRVLWHSCNGYSSGVDETKYPLDGLWSHVLQQHLAKPYHCQMGGGDQLYSDKVFDECRLLVDWIKIPSKRQRETYGWNNDLEQQVDEWYFHRYCKHFSRGGLSQAMAEIPYSFVLDDHDLFDGYGSYPERLQNCPIFQGVFKIAYKYYLIFQQQVQSTEMARAEGYFGEHGNSFIRHLGDKQAVLLVDTRRERTKDTVCSSSSWRKIWDALDNIPPSVQHLFVLLPVPIVYPRLKATEKGLALLSKGINGVGAIRAFTKQFQKKGVFTAMISKFGEPELLDDLCDHWTAKEHKSERKIVVETLQDFSEKHKVRVSFVGGDVHCAGSGRFWSSGHQDRNTDPHDMTQIITSAIVNEPPPDAVINVLHVNEKTHHLNTRTKEEMFELFTTDVNGKKLNNKKLMRRRNYATSELQDNGDILVEINVEQEDYKQSPFIYPVVIPQLRNK